MLAMEFPQARTVDNREEKRHAARVLEQGNTNMKPQLGKQRYRWSEKRNGTEGMHHSVALADEEKEKYKKRGRSFAMKEMGFGRWSFLLWEKERSALGKLKPEW